MRFVCLWCGAEFDEPESVPAGYFQFNPVVQLVCPECGQEDFERTSDEYDIFDIWEE